VVERRHVVAELLRDIDHLSHLVGPVAVVLHQDFAAQHAHQGVELQVPLRRVGRAWEGSLPPPALRGIYPVQLRVRRGSRVLQSRAWLYRVFQRGTASRPTFASPEGVVRWWVRFVRHRVAVALKRWPRPTFDLRDRRLHQLLVVAYRRAGDRRMSHRLGMFVTAVRDGFDGRWRLLEATVVP